MKLGRQQGRKRKASEEEATSTKRRQDIVHTRLIDNESEMGRKTIFNLNSYPDCSDGEGGGGHVRGGAAEVHDGRVQAKVQSARTVAHQELVSDRLGPYLAKTPAIKAASYKSQNLCIVVNTKNFIKSFCNDFIPVEFTKKDKNRWYNTR